MRFFFFQPLLVSFLVFGVLFNIDAQHDQQSLAVNKEFDRMLLNPKDYTSEERTEIYLTEASNYLSNNIDSAHAIYQQMVDFGISINDEYLTGVAFSSMAMLAGIQGRQEEQMRFEKQALKNTGGNAQFTSVMLGSLGESYMRINNLDSAQIMIDSSISIVTANQDTVLMAHAYLQKGELLKRQQKYFSALDVGLKALDNAEHSWTPMKKANVYQIIATNYREVGDNNKAIDYLQKALAITIDKGYNRFTAELQASLGSVYRSIGSIEIAQEYLLKPIAYFQEKEMNAQLCETYSQLALVELTNRNNGTAIRYIDEAKALLEDQSPNGTKAVFYHAQARTKLSNGNYNDAIPSFLKLIEIGEKSNTISRQISGYHGLQEIAVNNSDWKNAYTYSDKMNALRENADISNQQRLIADLESKYQSELKNEKIEKFRANQQVQDLIINRRERQLLYTGLALVLALASIVGFVTAYRTKQKSIFLLSDKNKKLNTALSTNKMLVKEIHHRVKNNLQVVSSLLNIQSRFEKDDTVIKAINSGKFRVQSMSLLHQNLYKNEDLNNINVKKYFTDLANGIVTGYPLNKNLNLILEIEDATLDLDTLVPLGLIANELITNSLKYAFIEAENCELKLSLEEIDGQIRMIVQDNGKGLPFDDIPKRPQSMGMQLIQSFAKKIEASIEIDNFKGAEVKVTFKKQNLVAEKLA